MAYNSKYTGAEVENLLGKIDDKQDTISDLASIREGAAKGATAVQPEDIPNEVELITISGDMLADEPTYTVTEAQAIIDAYNANKLIAIKCGTRINFGKGWFIPNINIRTQSGMSQIFLSGILGNYYIEHRIIYNASAGTISASAQSLIDLSESGGSAEPMVCAYRISSATANHIELENYTYNGQTMDYREGAIILITNPLSEDVVFEGGTLTLDGNEYEADAFTIKVGATTLFTLGVDSGILFPVSSVVESNSGGSSEGGSSAYAEVDHGTSDTTFSLTPNTFHVWDEVASLDLSLGAETTGVANEYLFQFTSGSTPTTLTLPDDIKFTDDLIIEANKIYQISILKGLGSALSWDSVTLIENKATYNEINATVTFQYPVASDLIVEVGMEPINISAGEQSGTIVGVPEPGAEIRSITPTSDSTYYYTF